MVRPLLTSAAFSLASLLTLPVTGRAQTRPPEKPACGLIGAWTLQELTDWDSTGTPSHPLGPHPRGLLIYTAHGQVSVHLAGDSSLAEIAGLYSSYYGTFSPLPDCSGVVHRILAGSNPADVGSATPRPLVRLGDTLILGELGRWQRVFVRVR